MRVASGPAQGWPLRGRGDIASLVFPTFSAYVFGKPASTPSNTASSRQPHAAWRANHARSGTLMHRDVSQHEIRHRNLSVRGKMSKERARISRHSRRIQHGTKAIVACPSALLKLALPCIHRQRSAGQTCYHRHCGEKLLSMARARDGSGSRATWQRLICSSAWQH